MPKVLVVGLLVALSQFIGVFTTSYLSVNGDYELMSLWANTESILALVTSVLFFGHQHVLNRKLVVSSSIDESVDSIRVTQGAIYSLSLLICALFSIIAIASSNLFYLFLAVVTVLIGVSPDFSLYGLSKPIHAGFISLLKVGGPSLVLLLLAVYGGEYEFLYVGVVTSYLMAAAGVLFFTKIGLGSLIFRVKNLQAYVSGYKLGVPSLLLTALRSTPIIVAVTLFASAEMVPLILFYKYFLLSVGVKRLFVQTYYREISTVVGAVKLDLFCFAMALLCCYFLFFFKDDISVRLGFGGYLWSYELCLCLVLFTFLGVSNGTRIIFLKRDSLYFFIHVMAMLVLVFGLIYGVVFEEVSSFVYGGLGAEVVLAAGMLFGRVFYDIRA
jgi:hypothetical protein